MEDPKRQLNMEEKKNLQRLLFSDITTASTKYKAARDKEREQLQKHLIEKAPPALRALLAQRKTARDTQSRLEKQLNESGYAIDTCRRGKTGRPPIAPELRTLIRRMTMENRVWGQRRIQAELARLGFKVSARTIAKYMHPIHRRGPSSRWRSFLRQHASAIWECDFFCVQTITFRRLYVFFVIHHASRSRRCADQNPFAARVCAEMI